MDADRAREDLRAARESLRASSRPYLRWWQPPLCAAAVFAGFCALGWAPYTVAWRAAAIAIALACWALAALMIVVVRARQGVRGFRGTLSATGPALIACALAILLTAADVSPDMRWMRWFYLIVGILLGGYLWIALRRQVRS